MRYTAFNHQTNEVCEDFVFFTDLECKAWLDHVSISEKLYPEEQLLADSNPEYRSEHCDVSGNLKKAHRLNFNFKPLQSDVIAQNYVEIFYEDGRGWLGYKQNDVMPSFLANQGIPGGTMYSRYDEESKTFDIGERL